VAARQELAAGGEVERWEGTPVVGDSGKVVE
jgi:hypothetical protein